MTPNEKLQIDVARRHGTNPALPVPGEKCGISPRVRADPREWPVNGLRHQPVGDTCGWYIWAGDQLSADPDFFVPVHVEHVSAWCPEVEPYLALPPGWRFLLAPGYEDVWFDPDLLEH